MRRLPSSAGWRPVKAIMRTDKDPRTAGGLLTPLPGSLAHTGTGLNQDRTGLHCGTGTLPGSWNRNAQWGTGWSRCHPVGGEPSETAWREIQPTTRVQMPRRFCHMELCCQTALPPFRVSVPINRKVESIVPSRSARGWRRLLLQRLEVGGPPPCPCPPTIHPGGQAHLL